MKRMKYLLVLGFIGILHVQGFAQEQKEDGTWWDNNLRFELIFEDLQKSGELEFCIYDDAHERCVYNLITSFEVRVFDASGKEIWNSLWSGKTTEIKFKQKLPEARSFKIKAVNPYVINKNTGTRIHQDKELTLEYKM